MADHVGVGGRHRHRTGPVTASSRSPLRDVAVQRRRSIPGRGRRPHRRVHRRTALATQPQPAWATAQRGRAGTPRRVILPVSRDERERSLYAAPGRGVPRGTRSRQRPTRSPRARTHVSCGTTSNRAARRAGGRQGASGERRHHPCVQRNGSIRRCSGHLEKVIDVATVGSQELRQRLKVDLLGLTALYAPELVTVHTHQLGSLTQGLERRATRASAIAGGHDRSQRQRACCALGRLRRAVRLSQTQCGTYPATQAVWVCRKTPEAGATAPTTCRKVAIRRGTSHPSHTNGVCCSCDSKRVVSSRFRGTGSSTVEVHPCVIT